MKLMTPTALLLALALPSLQAEEEKQDGLSLAETLAKHQQGSTTLAEDQDELSADVQELIEQQTNEEVIQLLEQVEELMAEVTGALDEAETGGTTIAAETEIIELIFEAAKKKQQSSGGT